MCWLAVLGKIKKSQTFFLFLNTWLNDKYCKDSSLQNSVKEKFVYTRVFNVVIVLTAAGRQVYKYRYVQKGSNILNVVNSLFITILFYHLDVAC